MRISYFLQQLFCPWQASCLICKSEQVIKYGLCSDCLKGLKSLEGERCRICLDRINTEGLCGACFKEKPEYTRLYCPYTYEAELRTLILRLKEGEGQYLKYPFVQMTLETVPTEVFNKLSLITWVPSSEKRKKQRGYDQARVIAEEISQHTHIPCIDVLVRLKDTKTALMNKEQRRKSIRGQYSFRRVIYGETVLLVDDVCTTAETLRACARALKNAGAKEVFCFAVARTEPKSP